MVMLLDFVFVRLPWTIFADHCFPEHKKWYLLLLCNCCLYSKSFWWPVAKQLVTRYLRFLFSITYFILFQCLWRVLLASNSKWAFFFFLNTVGQFPVLICFCPLFYYFFEVAAFCIIPICGSRVVILPLCQWNNVTLLKKNKQLK